MSHFGRTELPRCSACRGDYEDPDASADEGEDSAAETEESSGE